MINKVERIKVKGLRDGFTLLELLVVIGIIAVLVSLAAVSYSSAQKSSRDARRRSDMKTVQNALEQYYSASQFEYPASADCSEAEDAAYLERASFPDDPGSLVYNYSCSLTGYCVCAQLEKGGGNSGPTTCFSAGTDYYCVKNLQ